VQCEIMTDLPIVFEERAPLVLMQVAKFSASVPRLAALFRTVDESQIRRIVQKECLLDIGHGAGEIRQQIPRGYLIACNQSRDGAVVDSSHSCSAGAECDDGIEVSGLHRKRMSITQLGAALERMLAFDPTYCVGTGVQPVRLPAAAQSVVDEVPFKQRREWNVRHAAGFRQNVQYVFTGARVVVLGVQHIGVRPAAETEFVDERW